MSKIRLTQTDIDAIILTFKEIFALNDQLWIFGSRVRPEAKGGDIDLYIETNEANTENLVNQKIKFLVHLKLRIGDQKIDVVLNNHKITLPIYEIAKKEGIQLV